VKTNAGFLARCLDHPDFIAGRVDTGFIDARLDALAAPPAPSEAALAAAAATLLIDDESRTDEPQSPWRALTGFRLNAPPAGTVRLFAGDQPVDAPLWPTSPLPRNVTLADDGEIVVFEAGEAFVFTAAPAHSDLADAAGGDGRVRAPMPGKIAVVSVAVGQAVTRGQPLVTLEAMKMEHALTAPFGGEVAEVLVREGEQVGEGVALVRLTAA
jgi:acetyl/propionyl-CoA carboxylase alpha subunit